MLIVSVRLVRTVNSSDGEPVRGSSPFFQPLIHPKSLSPASLSFTGSVWVGTGAFRWVGCVVVPDLRLERPNASLSLYVAGPPSVVLNGFMILDCWLLLFGSLSRLISVLIYSLVLFLMVIFS